ncbi:MAG: IS1595 family transposase [Planctomycetes bacterium]|nr:IS1595 family transposase [Planctomycetota bacterium]
MVISTGEIETDESFIGGKMSNMSGNRKSRARKRYGQKGRKTIVHGLLQRRGEIRAKVVPSVERGSIETIVRKNVENGSTLYSDIGSEYFCGYYGYLHYMVNHAKHYVDGRIHTNGLENFWSLLKRCLRGTYIAVEPQHLQRYLDEQCRRFNMRKATDAERFDYVMQDVVGRRLRFQELTAK